MIVYAGGVRCRVSKMILDTEDNTTWFQLKNDETGGIHWNGDRDLWSTAELDIINE